MDTTKVNVEITTLNDVNIVEFNQETLDADNAKSFQLAINDLISSANNVIFDLKTLRFVDSSGLGTILSCLRRLNEAGGDLKLCEMSKPVRTMFELVRMHRVIDIYNSREEAINAF